MDGETFISFCAACGIAACFADFVMGRVRSHARRIRRNA